MSDETTTAKPTTDDLPEAIRKVSRAVDGMVAQGLNRRAVIVLLQDHSKLGRSTVIRVLDSLAELERAYTVRPTQPGPPARKRG